VIVEDGTGIPGANALATPAQVAEHLAGRATLVAGAVLASSAIAFSVGGAITAPSSLTGLVASRIIRISGAGVTGNNGWAYIKTVSAPVLGVVTIALAWLETATEAAGAVVGIEVYNAAGWWAVTPQALEGSIVAATESLLQLVWIGTIKYTYQTVPWPRIYAYTCKEGRRPLGELIPETEIPAEVIEAVARLAVDHLVAPIDATVTTQPVAEGQLRSKQIGPIKREWYEAPPRNSKYGRAYRPWLAPLLRGLYYEADSGPSRKLTRV
jgi:hypothetical protein